jgi:hypothetical protein
VASDHVSQLRRTKRPTKGLMPDSSTSTARGSLMSYG